MSIYLIAEERGLVAHHPFTGRLIRTLEGLACRLPDRLILDTAEYVAWFGQTTGWRQSAFAWCLPAQTTGFFDLWSRRRAMIAASGPLLRHIYPQSRRRPDRACCGIAQGRTDVRIELVGQDLSANRPKSWPMSWRRGTSSCGLGRQRRAALPCGSR